MVIVCKRCNSTFDTYSRLLNHLQRKKQCDPKYSNIDINIYINEVENIINISALKDKDMSASSSKSKVIEKKLTNFGEENMEALPDSLIHDLFLNLDVKELFENLHLDNNYPENKNIRYKEKLASFEVYEKNEWHRNTIVNGINKIILQSARIFEEYYTKNRELIREDMTEEEEKETLDELERLKSLDKSILESITKEIVDIIKVPKTQDESIKYIQSRPLKLL